MTEREYLNSRGLVYFWAKRYRAFLEGRTVVDIDDLIQAGALGLMEALETYQPEKGAWATWASFYIRKAMQEALGLRGGKPEPFVMSLDAPAYIDDGEASEITLLETLADPNNPDMDDVLLEDEIVRVVRAAVADLPEDQQAVTRLHDLEGATFKACDESMHLAQGEAKKISRRAHQRLWKDKRLRALRAIDQEMNFHRHKGVLSFHNSMTSVVEDLVLWRMEREHNMGL